jgi:hypothetical protein
LVLLAALPSAAAFAVKTDVVVLKNGDRLTGEVEQLERGHLQLKTDDLGSVQIEWDKIETVSASAPFAIQDVLGNRYLGSLSPGDPGQLRITWNGEEATLLLANVVRIRRLDKSFWKRLDGSIDVGASYTSASELFKLDFAGSLGWERPNHEVSANGSSTLTTQPGVDETRRSVFSVAYARFFKKRWVALIQGGLEQNKELGFDLRSAAALGGGRYLVRSSRDKLLTALGLSLNHEVPLEGEGTTNVEATAVVNYDRFSYDYPKVDVSIRVSGFASLTDSGRYRLELGASLKRELVKDFYATLRGYESYDNRPATVGAKRNDYGITFALGWSF